MIELEFVVANPAAQRVAYDFIKVFRAPTVSGTFVEVTTPTSRIALTDAITYPFVDPVGLETSAYRITYLNSRTGVESAPGEAVLGQTDPALDVLSVEQFKANYLFGLPLRDRAGNPYPPSIFTWYIQSAVSWLEHDLDIPIRPETVVAERHDFYQEEFQKWRWIELFRRPVIQVDEIRFVLPSQPGSSRAYPPEWIQSDLASGQVEIVPGINASALGLLAGGMLYPTLFGGTARHMPHVHEVDYLAGFPRGKVPRAIQHVVGMLASAGPLNIAGDMSGGVASYSQSLDGLQQAVHTRASAQYSAYAARLLAYDRELKRTLPMLRQYYQGIRATAG